MPNLTGLSEQEDQGEPAAILVPTTVEAAEPDTVATALERSPLIRSATGTVSTMS